MHNLNKKGYVLIEIIFAFAITFILIYFMMDLVINVKNKNDDLLANAIVKTDQTIVTNKLMDYAIKEVHNIDGAKKFCNKINIDNQKIMYGSDIVDIIDDYAIVKNELNCKVDNGRVSVSIPLKIIQNQNNYFNIVFDYKFDIGDMVPPDCNLNYDNNKTIQLNYKDNFGINKYYFGNIKPENGNVKWDSIDNAPSIEGTLSKNIDSKGNIYFAVQDNGGNICSVEKNIYSINYDMNGGSGSIDSQLKLHDIDIKLSSIRPEKSGFDFIGWGLSKEDTSATFYPNDTLSANGDIILYAIWSEKKSNPLTSYWCRNKTDLPEPYAFTYTGDCIVVDDGNGDWRIKFLTEGTKEFVSKTDLLVDVFAVDGGGNGGTGYFILSTGSSYGDFMSGGGGGGGYTKTKKEVAINAGKTYPIVVGSSASNSSGFGVTANGGGNGGSGWGGTGGSGGGGAFGGGGGIDGRNGGSGDGRYVISPGGKGQGTTTREFGEETGDLYAAGGRGGGYYGGVGANGTPNTGNGGTGGGAPFNTISGSGGSGIVIIRNARYLTLSFDANGGKGAPTEAVSTYGEAIKISYVVPYRKGYMFLGWSSSNNATIPEYQLGDNYVIKYNTTLYAVWSKTSFENFEFSCKNNSIGSSFYFKYTGNCTVIDDGNGDWRVKFLTNGIFIANEEIYVDVFAVGGGGNGGSGYLILGTGSSYGDYMSGGGGGGGYTNTVKEITIDKKKEYSIVIGLSANYSSGFGVTANGGGNGGSGWGGTGGSGGGGAFGGGGGIDGRNGGSGDGRYVISPGGKGQGTTTREFGEETGDLYSTGGGGGGHYGGVGANGTPNTGNGGSGGGAPHNLVGGKGGTGIIIIRNAR